VEFASKCDESCWNCRSNELSTLAQNKEGHAVDEYSAKEHKVNEEINKNMNIAASKKALCFTMTYWRANAVDIEEKQQRIGPRYLINDDRDITAEQLRGKIRESNNLSPQEQNDLYEV
jgi:hypothetical protein